MPVLWWLLATRGWACEPSPLQVRQMLPPDGGDGVPHNILPVALLGEGYGDADDYDLHVEEVGGEELDLTTLRFLFEDGAPSQHVVALTALLDADLAPDTAHRFWVEDALGDVLGEAEFTTGPESLAIGIPVPANLAITAVGDIETAETDCDYAQSRLFELEVTPNWADVYGIGSVEIYGSSGDATELELVAVADVPNEAEATIPVSVRISTSEDTSYCFSASNVQGGLPAPAIESVCYDPGFDTDYRSDPDYPANRSEACACNSGAASLPGLAVLVLLLASRRRGGGA